MALHPSVYAKLLGEKIAKHRSRVWLINTGWTGGPYGIGKRIPLPQTRAMLEAALSGRLNDVETRDEPFFGLRVPKACPGIPSKMLDPRSTWTNRKAYDEQARNLAAMFEKNFAQFADQVSQDVKNAGVRIGK